MKRSRKIQHTVSIDCLPNEAFNLLVDLRNDKLWWRQLTATEKITPGPIRDGTAFRQISSVFLVSIHSDVVIGNINRPYSFQLTNDSRQLVYNVTYKVDPVNNSGCDVTMIAEMQAHGILKWLQPLAARAIKRQLVNNFYNLKQVLEQQGTAVQAV